jgi:hypothetical protein
MVRSFKTVIEEIPDLIGMKIFGVYGGVRKPWDFRAKNFLRSCS